MQTKRRILLLLHLFLFLSSVLVTIYGIFYGFGVGQRGDMLHLEFFKTFTVDSNIFSGLVSLLVFLHLLKGKTSALPRWVFLLQYAAATSVGLTFLVVLLFLAPMDAIGGKSYFSAFYGTMFFFHFLNPLLAGTLFVCGNRKSAFGRKENFLSTLPMLLYAVYYMFSVVVFRTMDDFYGFTFGGHYALSPISVLVLYLVTYGIGKVLRICCRRK